MLWACATLLNPANNAGISASMTAIVPDAMQGRLSSAGSLVANSSASLAPFLAGVLLTAVNSLTATLFGSLVGIAAVAPILVNRQTRTLGRPSAWQHDLATVSR